MPPGRSTATSDSTAGRTSSTCSRTPWQRTRSALPGADHVEQPRGVALDRVDDGTGLAGPAQQRGQGVGAGVDDGDPVAGLGQRDGEPAGAPADVDHVQQVVPSRRSRP